MEKEKLDYIIECALRSPSSRSLNPWSFITVTDKDTLKRLARAKFHGSGFLKGAPLGIVVCADPNVSDVWVEDTSIAAIIIQLAAHDIGLGSCWIQIRNRFQKKDISSEKFIQNVLGMEEHIKVEAIISIGYADEEKDGHAKDSLQYEKVSTFESE